MTLSLPERPVDGDSRAADLLAGLPPPDGGETHSLVEVGPLLYAPIPTYSAPNGELANADIPLSASAIRTGWRYIIDEHVGFALADLFDGKFGGSVATRGEGARAWNEAALAAERQSGGKGEFEVRCFIATDIGFQALWLHTQTGQSYVVAVSGNAPNMQPLEEWLVAVRRAAAIRIAAQRKPIEN